MPDLVVPPIEVPFSRRGAPERFKLFLTVLLYDFAHGLTDGAARCQCSEAVFLFPSPVERGILLAEGLRRMGVSGNPDLSPIPDPDAFGFAFGDRNCHMSEGKALKIEILHLFTRTRTLSAPLKTPAHIRVRRLVFISRLKSSGYLVGPRGLEPRTNGLRVHCSTN